MASIVTTERLTHAYGDVVAISDVTLDIPEGRIGLVGANGAGKTTLLRILLGILEPGSGAVTVLGIDPQADPIAVRARIGYMPEGDCLPVTQTAADFMIYAAELAGIPPRAARQRASDVLTLVGLDEERFRALGDFSTGMKQRAKLAQAIVHDPDLVLLDEPTAGLDPDGRDEMLGLISRLGSFGINVITSSHVLSDIERTCDWVVMLDGGNVLRHGPIATLLDPGTVDVEVFDDPAALVAALQAGGAAVTVIGAVITVTLAEGDPLRVVRDALAATGASVRRMGGRAQTLESIYLASDTGQVTT